MTPIRDRVAAAQGLDASPTFVSLYSGAGGLDAGFLSAGFTPIWANDFDPVAVATYNANIGGSHAVAGDIDGLRARLPGPGEADLVIGGPPCQGFSVAGHMRPDDPRSRHVWTFLDIVRDLQPRGFVMENVAALATNPRWAHVIAALRARALELGYAAELFVLNASHFEVPQARMRMFLVGVHDGTPHAPQPRTPAALPTVRRALAALPRWGEPGNDAKCTAIVTPARKPVLRPSPYAGMVFNGKGRVLNLDAPAPTLAASMGGNRTPIIDQQHLDGGDQWILDYHRHLRAGGAPIDRIPERMRRLTIQEAAALQTFPPGWAFEGRQSAQFRQIGNAVPPRLAHHVACAVAAALDAQPAAAAALQPIAA